MPNEVTFTRQGAIATIRLNRPSRLNAFNDAMRIGLLSALRAVADDGEVRTVVLRGEGQGFSAGQDLTDVPDGTDLGALLSTGYTPIVELIRTMPKPVIAAVHGVAAGAGANLALACDIVVATESARFIQAFVRIGLLPDVGGSWFLPRLVGTARARALALLGTPLSGTDAAAWGMIYRAVPDETFETELETLAATLAELPAQAIASIKRTFDAAMTNDLATQLTLESSVQSELGRSLDFAEGKRAFLEKRPARFASRTD